MLDTFQLYYGLFVSLTQQWGGGGSGGGVALATSQECGTRERCVCVCTCGGNDCVSMSHTEGKKKRKGGGREALSAINFFGWTNFHIKPLKLQTLSAKRDFKAARRLRRRHSPPRGPAVRNAPLNMDGRAGGGAATQQINAGFVGTVIEGAAAGRLSVSACRSASPLSLVT